MRLSAFRSSAFDVLALLAFLLISPFRWLYQPSRDDLHAHGTISRVTILRSADLRAGSFKGFLERARGHVNFNGVGFTQAHRSVVPI